MRPAPLAVVALFSALLGGVSALAIARTAGLARVTTETVVVSAPASGRPAPVAAAPPAAVASPAKPLAGNRFDPARIYTSRSPGVVTIYAFFGDPTSATQAAQGSGFVVSPKGYILTNSHVITNAGEGDPVHAASRIYVEFADHDRAPATVVGWDVFDDVGLLKVDPAAHPLSPVPLGDSSRAAVGEPVAAIGSPFGNENSLTVGVISAIHRSIASLTSEYNVVDAIQTDAPITHGNSGGPLFDARGEVIGINAQIRTESGNGEGVGFAVPIDAARRSMAQLIAKGKVEYSYIGIKTENLTPSIARRFHYSTSYGAVVAEVKPGSPGERAGLRGATGQVFFDGDQVSQGGDVIVAIDGKQVRSADDVVRIVSERLVPGDQATFTVVRGAKRLQIPVLLGARPANPAS